MSLGEKEEIGEIIESAPTTSLRITDEPKCPTQPEKSSNYANESFTPRSLPTTKSHGFVRRQNSLTKSGEDIGDWSNSILAEFNSIIAKEISELTKEKKKKEAARSDDDVRVIQYKELLNEFGLSDSESSDRTSSGEHEPPQDGKSLRDRRNGRLFVDDDDCRCLLNSDYDEPHDRVIPEGRKSDSLPENLQDVIGKRGRFHTTDALSSDYDEPSNCLPMNSIRSQIDRITSSLPSKLERGCPVPKDARFNPCHAPKTPVGLSTRTNEDISVDVGSPFKGAEEEAGAKLPPRQRSERKISLPINLTNQKRRKAARLQRLRRGTDDQETMNPDYDDVFVNEEIGGRSRSLDNRVPKSAPVTPTEEKKPPFSKLLRKRHISMFHESSDDVILVSVSSLPDQDLLRLRNDRHLRNETKNGKANSKETLTKKRAISPLTLRSDITAKRLSESDRDIRQVSPVDLKKFSLVRPPWSNDVAVSCDLPENDDIEENCGIENGTLGKLEHVDVKKIMEEQNARAGSSTDGLSHLLRYGDSNLAGDFEEFQLHLGQRLRLSPRLVHHREQFLELWRTARDAASSTVLAVRGESSAETRTSGRGDGREEQQRAVAGEQRRREG
ncbi:rho gtpase-activating protein 7 isoform x2 [Lasius niger]|uniref:Rho gtpase-activating protein 7 isoform x2 n=1 Tax=Lasius niger TaxID=67767 RepID=A0A0J7L694_LASNI|nr:rho gtpase-activating protein 7 isoform x2 [Lasius niger]